MQGARGFTPALRAAVLAAGGARRRRPAGRIGLRGGRGHHPAPRLERPPRSFCSGTFPSPRRLPPGPGAGAPPAGASPADLIHSGRSTHGGAARDPAFQGWSCPELRELGYHLVWARAGVLAGEDVLELRLTDGRNFATILEQHGELARAARRAGSRAASRPVPVNVLTGHPATSDGFTAAAAPGVLRGAAAAGAGRRSLWVNHGPPFAAIYQSGDATFTYVSDQPSEHAADGVAALLGAAPGAAGSEVPDAAGWRGGAGGRSPGDNFAVRLERGLGRIMELLAP